MGCGMLCLTVLCSNVRGVFRPLQSTDIMYYPLPSRLIVILMLCSLWLQGCRPSFRVTSEEPIFKKLRKTSDDERAMDQVSVPDSRSSVSLDVPGSRLPTAASVALPLIVTSTAQVTLPLHRLAVKRDVVPTCEQVSSTEAEAIEKTF